jgi:cell division septum initiation protein DivIVA
MQTSTEILSQRMQQKLELLGQLRELGLHQVALIDAGDMAQLLRLLAAKQRVLSALTSVERALDPFRGQDPEKRIWSSPDDRQRCAQMAADCERLLAMIVERERHSQMQMSLRRDEVSARLEAARGTVEAQRAYANSPHYPANQLDLTQG